MADFDTQRSLQKNRIRRRGIYLLPNLFTTAALFAGFYATVQAMNLRFDQAAVAIFVAMVLDGLDGRVARLTRTQSAFGAEYDSLADMVSFGAAPGADRLRMGAQGHGQPRLDRRVRLRRRRRAAARALQRHARRRRQALVHRHSEPGGRRAGRGFRLDHRRPFASIRSAFAGGPGRSRCSRASRWSATSRTTASRRSI